MADAVEGNVVAALGRERRMVARTIAMICSIQQPRYLPSMSYFDRIAKSDVHVVLDHVTLSKGDFVNRCQIMQRDGRPMWLTIPVSHGGPICEFYTDPRSWREKHAKAVKQAYGVELPDFASYGTERLDQVCWRSCVFINQSFPEPIETECVSSAQMGGDRLGAGSDLILNLCKEVGATTYLSGPHGRDYLDLPAFDKAGIQVEWHDYPVVQPVLSAVHDLFGRERVASGSSVCHSETRRGRGY